MLAERRDSKRTAGCRRELTLDGRGIPMAARKATVKVTAIGSHKEGKEQKDSN